MLSWIPLLSGFFVTFLHTFFSFPSASSFITENYNAILLLSNLFTSSLLFSLGFLISRHILPGYRRGSQEQDGISEEVLPEPDSSLGGSVRLWENEYRTLLDAFPFGLMEVDLSEVRNYLLRFSGEGVSDFASFFSSNPDTLEKCLTLSRIRRVNNSLLRLYDTDSPEELSHLIHTVLRSDLFPLAREIFIALLSGTTAFDGEGKLRLTQNSETIVRHIGISLRIRDGFAQDWKSVIVVMQDITERKRNEESMMHSSAILEKIFNNSYSLIAYLDPQFRFIRVNQAYARVENKRPDFFTGKNHFDIYPNEQNQKLFQKVVEKGEPHFEFARPFEYIRQPDRGITYWDWSLIPIKDNTGKVTGLLLNLLNVTERIMAEANLVRLATLIEQAPVSCIITDTEGGIVYVNPFFENLTGYTFDMVRGQNPRLLKSGQVDPGVYQELWNTIKEGGTWKGTFINRRRDGSLFHEEANIFPIRDDTGQIVNYAAVKRDITDHVMMERELVESREKYATLFWIFPMGITISDRAGNVVEMNPAMRELLEIEDNVILPHPFLNDDCRLYFPDGSPMDRADFALIKALERHVPVLNQVMGFSKNDRPIRWLSVNATPIPLDRYGVALACMDVTDRIQAQKELERYKGDLEKRVEEEVERQRHQERMLIQQSRLATMGEMIGNIAHQWRQPLNALALTIQDLSDAYDYKELNREYLTEMVDNSMKIISRMSSTIDDFRYFFAPDKQKEYFEALDAVKDSLAIIHASLLNNDIRVEMSAKKNPQVYGYHNEYAQVLLNLLNNAKDALKLNRESTEDRTIWIEIDQSEEGRSVVTISDNGGGVPGEIADKIFEPYFTTKFASEGTGIGLYMAKMIIEKNMGGLILFENGSEGARFSVVV